jgi:kojibiose phosphorylase
MTGNGYLGYRGTFPEWSRDQYVACTVTDTYDNADGKWTELCTVPNALFFAVECAGASVTALAGGSCPANQGRSNHGPAARLSDYSRTLNFRYGIHTRSMTWTASGAAVTLEDRRFASYGNLHLLAARHRITANAACELTITSGIDGEVWSMNGEHFSAYEPSETDAGLEVRTVTQERGVEVIVAEAMKLVGGPGNTGAASPGDLGAGGATPGATETGERGIMRRFTLTLTPGEPVEIEKFMVVYTSNDVEDPRAAAASALARAVAAGYDALVAEHQACWDAMWETSDIEIDGDEKAQALLRYNIYHNFIATPQHTDHLPIGARGLSCQAYQGSAFWDEEIYNLPMYLYTRPTIARNILAYRYRTLAGARKKARDLGYTGAFYAWVSADTGEEICPSYFFIDVLTGRRIHNHFNDWQIHVSPDIAYTVWRYYQVTGDWEFMREYGAEIIFDVAQFLVSRAHYRRDKGRYEYIRLLGPDEYHENVDNNFFTNYQARYVFERALELREMLASRAPEKLRELEHRLAPDAEAWGDMAERMYVKEPDPETGVIEAFDGFFDLEDITPAALKERLLDPGEYWGWPNGIAVETQVSKQADVTQLFMLHPEAYPREVMQANLEYYEPRTQHGSSLSPSVYGIVGAWVGHEQTAYDYFIHSCSIDLLNTNKAVSGGTFIGGIHTASCGIAWQMVTVGFLGMYADGSHLRLAPALPAAWNTVRFNVVLRGRALRVEVSRQTVRVISRDASDVPITIQVAGERHTLAPGGELEISC